jgi:ribosomal protein L11 methyltransferase
VTRSLRALDLHFPFLAGDGDLPGRVAAALDDLSPAAVHETGDDDRPTWRIFPADQSQLDVMASMLAAAFGPSGCRLETVDVEDEDWAARTQANLTRVAVGRLIVSPPWDVPEALPPGSHLVVIQPSMGFGTGHHETTRLCLRLLQDVDLEGRRVVDLGTGSGVLAMAAHLLGAREVEGLDVDEDALVSARESLALNGLTERIALRRADLRTDRIEPADVVLANLTGALLIAQAPLLVGLARRGGRLVLSGFQCAETDAVQSAFGSTTTLARVGEGDWEALLLRIPT